MTPSASTLLLAAIIAGAIIIAIPLALLIDAIRAWLKHREIWKAIESAPRDGFKLHERPSNVCTLVVRKPTYKSAPKSAA